MKIATITPGQLPLLATFPKELRDFARKFQEEVGKCESIHGFLLFIQREGDSIVLIPCDNDRTGDPLELGDAINASLKAFPKVEQVEWFVFRLAKKPDNRKTKPKSEKQTQI